MKVAISSIYVAVVVVVALVTSAVAVNPWRYTFNADPSVASYDILNLDIYVVTDNVTSEVIPPQQVVVPSSTSIIVVPIISEAHPVRLLVLQSLSISQLILSFARVQIGSGATLNVDASIIVYHNTTISAFDTPTLSLSSMVSSSSLTTASIINDDILYLDQLTISGACRVSGASSSRIIMVRQSIIQSSLIVTSGVSLDVTHGGITLPSSSSIITIRDSGALTLSNSIICDRTSSGSIILDNDASLQLGVSSIWPSWCHIHVHQPLTIASLSSGVPVNINNGIISADNSVTLPSSMMYTSNSSSNVTISSALVHWNSISSSSHITGDDSATLVFGKCTSVNFGRQSSVAHHIIWTNLAGDASPCIWSNVSVEMARVTFDGGMHGSIIADVLLMIVFNQTGTINGGKTFINNYQSSEYRSPNAIFIDAPISVVDAQYMPLEIVGFKVWLNSQLTLQREIILSSCDFMIEGANASVTSSSGTSYIKLVKQVDWRWLGDMVQQPKFQSSVFEICDTCRVGIDNVVVTQTIMTGTGEVAIGAFSGRYSSARLDSAQLTGTAAKSLEFTSGMMAGNNQVSNTSMTYVDVQLNGEHTLKWRNTQLSQGKFAVDDRKYGMHQYVIFSGNNNGISDTKMELPRYPSFTIAPDSSMGDTSASLILKKIDAVISATTVFDIKSFATLNMVNVAMKVKPDSDANRADRATIIVRSDAYLNIKESFTCDNGIILDGGVMTIQSTSGSVAIQHLIAANNSHTFSVTGSTSSITMNSIMFNNLTTIAIQVTDNAALNYGFASIKVSGNAYLAGELVINFTDSFPTTKLPNNDYELFKVQGNIDISNLVLRAPTGAIYHVDNRVVYRMQGEPQPLPASTAISTAAVIGIAGGAGVIVLGAICCYYRRRRHNLSTNTDYNTMSGDTA